MALAVLVIALSAAAAFGQAHLYVADTNGNIFTVTGADRRVDLRAHLPFVPRAIAAVSEDRLLILWPDGVTVTAIDAVGVEVSRRAFYSGPYTALTQVGATTYALASDSRRARIDVLDLWSGSSVPLMTVDIPEVRDLAAEENGSFVLLAGSGASQRLFRLSWPMRAISDLTTGELRITHIAIAEDGELVASTDSERLAVIDTTSGAAFSFAPHIGAVASLSGLLHPRPQGSTVPGDANGDGIVTVTDVFYLINYLFTGGPPPVGPGDANGDGIVTVTDVFYLINYLFTGGAPPVSRTPPVLSAVTPATLFQGDTIAVWTLTGSGLSGANAILFDTTGLTTSNVASSADGTSVTARLQVALNAPPGATAVRISTPAGVSNRLTLQIVQSGGGLLGSFYNGATFDANGLPVISGTPLFQRWDSAIQFGASTGFRWRPCLTGSTICVGSSFSVRWEGMIFLDQAGTYTFATNSSDASRLQISGQDIVLNSGIHAATQKSGAFNAPAPGSYPLVLTFGSSSGTPGIDLLYQPPSGTLAIVPSTALWNKGTLTNPIPATATAAVSFFNPAPAPSTAGTTLGISTASISYFNPDVVSPPKSATIALGTAVAVSFFNPAPLPLPSGGASPTGRGVAVVNGPAALSVAPAQITRGTGGSMTLTLSGANLTGATTVTLNPSTGITVGAPTVSPDGKTVTVALGLTSSTPTGIVQVSVSSSSWSTPITAQTRFEVVP